MRNEAFAKLNRVAGGQMRPFGTIETRELRIIGIINPRRVRHLQKRIPVLLAWGEFIFEFLQSSTVWEADKNNLAAASPNLFDGSGHIGETFSDSFLHLRHETILRDVTRRRRRREEPNPDLLNLFRQFASRFSALLPHPRTPLAIFGLKIRRESRRDARARTIRNRQLIQKSFETEVVWFQKGDVFFQPNAELFAHALGRRLIVKSFHAFF